MDKDGNKIGEGIDWPKPKVDLTHSEVEEPEPMPPHPTDDCQFAVYDYIEEFMAALMIQLRADHKRWGAAWRNRAKKGQELRTKEIFNDYFDQFYWVAEPVPWLMIVGNAMICWIREQHPEVCPDVVAEFSSVLEDAERDSFKFTHLNNIGADVPIENFCKKHGGTWLDKSGHHDIICPKCAIEIPVEDAIDIGLVESDVTEEMRDLVLGTAPEMKELKDEIEKFEEEVG